MSKLNDALLWLMQREHMGAKLGLNNITRLLDALGRPERAYPIVQIAGTNGKGSTAAALAEMLKRAGLRVGMFTSPHIVSPKERFLLNGKYLDDHLLTQAILTVRKTVEHANINATFFECCTAAAAVAFSEADADVAIFEVGMGGRLDATTALENRKLAVLTRIGIDHTKHLGHTIESIAAEKAGIFIDGMTAVLAPQPLEAQEVFQNLAAKRGVSLVKPKILDSGKTTLVEVDNQRVKLEAVSLRGRHQRTNVATAAAAALVGRSTGLWHIEDSAIIEGAAKFFWPLRLQLVETQPKVLLDVAHNLDGARVLAEFLSNEANLPPKDRRVAVVALLADKQHGAILRELSRVVGHFVFTRAFSHRAAEPEVLLDALRAFDSSTPAQIVSLPVEALAYAKAEAGADGLVVATGSFYMLSALVEWLEKSGVPLLAPWRTEDQP